MELTSCANADSLIEKLENSNDPIEKTESFRSKLNKASDDMTSKQLSRYMEITTKMTSAAMSM